MEERVKNFGLDGITFANIPGAFFVSGHICLKMSISHQNKGGMPVSSAHGVVNVDDIVGEGPGVGPRWSVFHKGHLCSKHFQILKNGPKSKS